MKTDWKFQPPPETKWYFEDEHWNHWFMLLALTCDGGNHGWLIGSLRQLR